MSTPITYYAIIGRIPEDDEDSCYFFESDDPNFDYDTAFTDCICQDAGLSIPDREAIIKGYGNLVYINHVLRSKSPIT